MPRKVESEATRAVSRTFSCDSQVWTKVLEAAMRERMTVSKWLITTIKKELEKQQNG